MITAANTGNRNVWPSSGRRADEAKSRMPRRPMQALTTNAMNYAWRGPARPHQHLSRGSAAANRRFNLKPNESVKPR